MKSIRKRTLGLLALVHVIAVVLAVAFAGPLGLIVACVNPYGVSAVLGVSYPVINATTYANMVADTAKAAEELWVRSILFGADRLYQENPFTDNMIGGPGSGKPIISITETNKVAGNVINIPTVAGFGGPGVFGAGNRIGAEQKIKVGNFQCRIGKGWFGAGYNSQARDETVIGSMFDKTVINPGLKKLLAKKRSDDCIMRMRHAAYNIVPTGQSAITIGSRNLIRPTGVASLATIKTANVISTSFITKMGDTLPSLGADPMNIAAINAQDSGGSKVERYLLLATSQALRPLSTEQAYLDAKKDGGVRGSANPVFTGQYVEWDGHGIYRWYMRDHANKGPVGSPLCPRAFLGGKNTSGTVSTASSLTIANGDKLLGGGMVYDSTDDGQPWQPKYFEFFLNAPYTYFNGDAVAADASTTRHVIIINPDGSYGVWPYVNNDGKEITISGTRLSIGVGTETSTYNRGAIIAQCNILGATVGWSLGLGSSAVVCGAGSIDGKTVDPQMGQRTFEVRNHNSEYGIGVEAVWGNAAVQRAGDNAFPGFVLMEHAVPVEGAPTIT